MSAVFDRLDSNGPLSWQKSLARLPKAPAWNSTTRGAPFLSYIKSDALAIGLFRNCKASFPASEFVHLMAAESFSHAASTGPNVCLYCDMENVDWFL